MADLSSYRKSYDKEELLEDHLTSSPIDLFERWFKEVENHGAVAEVNAMTVSTLGEDGYPKSRIVLLKHYDEDGFVFYTNYTSEKGQALKQHPKASLSFFWPELQRQVIIKGDVAKVSSQQSEAYFESRPRGSQLGAWASNQSASIASRDKLEEKLSALEQKYANRDIPKPPFWGGFRVSPISIEFWQGRPNRLHDRILYVKDHNNWKTTRLEP